MSNEESQKFKDARALAQFRRLTGLIDNRNEEILADPLRFIRLASEEIRRLNKELDKLKQLAFSPPKIKEHNEGEPISMPETVVVTREDYERLNSIKDALFELI